MTPGFGSRWRELRRAASWHRRLLAAGLAAGAVAAGLQVLEPPPAPTTSVLAAARDLTAGVALTATDIVTVALPAAALPAGYLMPGADVVGRTVASPVRAGETITDVRLVGPALVGGLAPGLVAAPVRVADAAMVALVRPGDRVDVLATLITGDGTEPTEVVGGDLLVIVVPEAGGTTGYSDGALIVVATTPTTARALAAATVTTRLSLTILSSELP